MNIKKVLAKKAKQKNKTIIFPEAGFSDRIVEAARIIAKKGLANVILIADESAMAIRFKKLKNVTILNPKTFDKIDELSNELYEIRKEKGMTKEKADELVLEPFYFATMLLKLGYADGIVGGAEVPTSTTLRPALEIIKTKNKLASSTMLFFGKNKNVKLPIMISDPGFIPSPTSEQLSQLAYQTTQTLDQFFGHLITPRIAFLSYSTKGSAKGDLVEKMQNATALFKKEHPEFHSDGELQMDAAISPRVAEKKCPDSTVAGHANILILPDLNVGNITYKTMQYFGGLKAIGPIVQGLNKPVNDLSRGCTVEEIVIVTMLTAIQCED